MNILSVKTAKFYAGKTVYKAGVPRHLTMSSGFELAQTPAATSEMIKDEQIKVIGCRFASGGEGVIKRE